MPAYRFCTTWVLEADRERVWDAIYDSDSWPEWWRGVTKTERLADGDENGIGQRGVYHWRARLPYTVRFEIVSTAGRAAVPARRRRLGRAGGHRLLAVLRGGRDHGGHLRLGRQDHEGRG